VLNSKSQDLYEAWYNGLDAVDRELVDKVEVIRDDDYPFELHGRLSQEAASRAGLHKAEVGWTVLWRPFPSQQYYDALREEQKAAQVEQKRIRLEIHAKQLAENARWQAWKGEQLKGLVCCTVYIPTPYWGTPAYEGFFQEHFHFAAGWQETGMSYASFGHQGHTVWRESYGNAVRFWVPPALAAHLYQQQWDSFTAKMGEAKTAFYALSRIITGLNCFGDDLYEWAKETIGLQQLVQICKDAAPIDLGSNPDMGKAIASKFWRIPVHMTFDYPAHEEMVEYGYARWTVSRLLSPEQQAESDRLHGWVLIGEEERQGDRFPTLADIEHQSRQGAEYAAFFSEIAGW